MAKMTGTEVRGIREALGLTVPTFATVLGVHQSTVHRWEAAGGEPVTVEGVPWNVLSALRRRVLEERLDPAVARAKGSEVSEALVLGGALLALGLLIMFVAKGK